MFFEKWNKEIETPVSGLFEYYDVDEKLLHQLILVMVM